MRGEAVEFDDHPHRVGASPCAAAEQHATALGVAADAVDPPHRHTRDYVAIFPNAGELTIIPAAGDSVAREAEEVEALEAERVGVRQVVAAE